MTTWIVGIDQPNPEHWGYALKHGYWDMTTQRPFEVGDTLVFWQGGGSLLGSVTVTRASRKMPLGTWMPWNLDDSKRNDYRFRVEFEVAHPTAMEQPRWSEVKRHAHVTAATNFGPRRVPPEGEGWLMAQIGTFDAGRDAADRMAREWWTANLSDVDVSALEEEMRLRIEAAIVLRQGQPRFRRETLRAWGSKCCITGTAVESVLDAAHIVPHRGAQTDIPSNALLLRTDLHTLFDRHLLTITPSGTVRVSPSLAASDYARLEGRRMSSPISGPGPASECLEHHNAKCEWLQRP